MTSRQIHLYCVLGDINRTIAEKTLPFKITKSTPLTSGIGTFNSCLTNLDPHNSGFTQENRTVKLQNVDIVNPRTIVCMAVA